MGRCRPLFGSRGPGTNGARSSNLVAAAKGLRLSGPRSSAQFTLQELLDSVPVPPTTGVTNEQVTALAQKQYRLPLLGIAPLKLPKDVTPLEQWLTGDEGNVGYAALYAPTFLVPLTSTGKPRRLALISLVSDTSGPTAVIVRVEVTPGATRFEHSVITGCDVQVARGQDLIAEFLEVMWLEADPVVGNQGHDGVALWLSPDLSRSGADAKSRISAIGAVYGYRLEYVRDASRHVGDVKSRLGDSTPELVIVWEPHGHALDGVLTSYRNASADGDVLELSEPVFQDALIELRLELADRAGADDSAVLVSGSTVPQSGDERYYIKFRGSAVGDRMIEVKDCGHNKWGSDQKRKAPRADKGLGATVGARPKTLYKCAMCKKNRWLAKF